MAAAAACLVGRARFHVLRAAGVPGQVAGAPDAFGVGPAAGDVVLFDFHANAFLHHMIRKSGRLAGVRGEGRRPVGWMANCWARNRSLAAPTFRPDGFYLWRRLSAPVAAARRGRIIAPPQLPAVSPVHHRTRIKICGLTRERTSAPPSRRRRRDRFRVLSAQPALRELRAGGRAGAASCRPSSLHRGCSSNPTGKFVREALGARCRCRFCSFMATSRKPVAPDTVCPTSRRRGCAPWVDLLKYAAFPEVPRVCWWMPSSKATVWWQTFDWSLIPDQLPALILPAGSTPGTSAEAVRRPALGCGCVERRGGRYKGIKMPPESSNLLPEFNMHMADAPTISRCMRPLRAPMAAFSSPKR